MGNGERHTGDGKDQLLGLREATTKWVGMGELG